MQYDFLSVERFLDEYLPAVVDEHAGVIEADDRSDLNQIRKHRARLSP